MSVRHSTTQSRSASSKTMTGALPPSSRCTRLRVSAALRAISLPVDTSPVTDTMATFGLATSAAPAVSPGPSTTLSTPGGRMSALSSASRIAVSGVSSDGFSTTVLPAARAGPIFHVAMLSG